MSATITIGAWALPLIGTIIAFGVAIYAIPKGGGDYNFAPLVGCAYLPLAGCASLAMWLMWAVLA